MSEEDVETVKAGLAAHNRGDVDALVEVYDPDAVFETLLLGTHHGNEAIRLIYEENPKTMSGYDVVPVELIDVDDTIVAIVESRGSRLPPSEISVDDGFASSVHRQGQSDRARAGIPEQRGSPRSRRAVRSRRCRRRTWRSCDVSTRRR